MARVFLLLFGFTLLDVYSSNKTQAWQEGPMSQAQLYCRITNTTTCEKLPSVNGKQRIYIRKKSSTSKSKRSKQENAYADKIQTNFDPRNAERNLKDEIDLKSNFQNTSRHK